MLEVKEITIPKNAAWEFFKSDKGINCIGVRIGSERWAFYAWEKTNKIEELRVEISRQWGIETLTGPALDRKASVKLEKVVLWGINDSKLEYIGIYVPEEKYDLAHVSALRIKPVCPIVS